MSVRILSPLITLPSDPITSACPPSSSKPFPPQPRTGRFTRPGRAHSRHSTPDIPHSTCPVPVPVLSPRASCQTWIQTANRQSGVYLLIPTSSYPTYSEWVSDWVHVPPPILCPLVSSRPVSSRLVSSHPVSSCPFDTSYIVHPTVHTYHTILSRPFACILLQLQSHDD